MQPFVTIGSYVENIDGYRGLVVNSDYITTDYNYSYSDKLRWDWAVLYEDGVIRGANNDDLELIQ